MTEKEEPECNGICLTAADIGVPEYGGDMIAYAHPDCPAHGDPLENYPELEICGSGEESLRYVREEDVAPVGARQRCDNCGGEGGGGTMDPDDWFDCAVCEGRGWVNAQAGS